MECKLSPDQNHLSAAAKLTKQSVKALACRCETDGRAEPRLITDDGGNASDCATVIKEDREKTGQPVCWKAKCYVMIFRK